MPGRLRSSAAHEPAEEDVTTTTTTQAQANGHSKLGFRDPLSWRAGRAIPVAELLRSLKKLSDELQAYDQEDLSPSDVSSVAKDLASAHLLAHKDKGVRARTAVCIVDILMLTAPNAPFKGNQLKVGQVGS